MTRSTDHVESTQPPTETNDPAFKNRVASSTSLNALSAANSDTENSERPVREKLKNTTIDGRLSDNAPTSDHPMGDAADNAQGKGEDEVTSSSDNDRGRLRRKRSFEEIEGDHAAATPSEKPERHTRKKSRDIKHPDPAAAIRKTSAESSVGRIEEQEGEETLKSTGPQDASNSDQPTTGAGSMRAGTPETLSTNKAEVLSPKNKRSRATYLEGQNKEDVSSTIENQEGLTTVEEAAVDSKNSEKPVAGEPKMKRSRESNSPKPREVEAELPKTESKIPAGSGFANTSAASPFAALSPGTQSKDSTGLSSLGGTKASSEGLQTSTEKFKASGFSSFASSASPFGATGGSGSNSPFAAASTGGKPALSSFASPQSSASPPAGGFGALGSSGQSAFGGTATSLGGGSSGFGSGFGAVSGSGFGAIRKNGLSSFAGPGGSAGITGLSSKPVRPFGSTADDEDDDAGSDDEDGVKSPTATEANSDKQAFEKEDAYAQDKRFFEQEHETGEEEEEAIWAGRAKLFTFSKEGEKSQWKERGAGNLKLNVSRDTPKKPRFVMRRDGTHQVILNAPIIKSQKYGTAEGEEPTNGQLTFLGPVEGKASELEAKLLRLKPKNAEELYDAVIKLQEEL